MSTSNPNGKTWRTITGIGHGAAWAADGYNYDDLKAYPPGFMPGFDSGRAWAERWRMEQSMKDRKGMERGVDRRWVMVQGAVLGVEATPVSESASASTLTAAWVDLDADGLVRGDMHSRTTSNTPSSYAESNRSSANTSPTSSSMRRSTSAFSSAGTGTVTPVTEYDYKCIDGIVGVDVYGSFEGKSGLRGEAVGFVSGRREHCVRGEGL